MTSSPDKLLCIWQHTEKNTFLSKGHNSAKTIQPKKPCNMRKDLDYRSIL
jgi:hypothetical protein